MSKWSEMIRNKWSKVSADRTSLTSFIVSSVVHMVMFGALIYAGSQQLMNDEIVDVQVEDLKKMMTTNNPGDPNSKNKKKGAKASAPAKAETAKEIADAPKKEKKQC